MSELRFGRGTVVSDTVRAVNEDLGIARPTVAWVLDGATGVGEIRHTPGRTDAEWYVERLSGALLDRVHRTDDSLTAVVRDAVSEVSAAFESVAGDADIDPASEPSAAGAIVRVDGPTLEYLVLCDCSLLVHRNGQLVDHVTDARIESLEARSLSVFKRHRANGLDAEDAREAVVPTLRKHRRRKNTPGNYWVLSTDPDAVDHALTGTVAVEAGDKVCLLTDGLARLVDTYDHFADWAGVAAALDDAGPDVLLEPLRRIERADPEARTHPRLKCADDATLVRLGIETVDDQRRV
ncbi:protein phosphatase 2C domain-containing protein [Halosimplex halophilum]|uniref:protein phosphatase 2C domain-containing protein n=1 Tax=Halosimplex halophilum TaxID=2559572 RepID=UPI00107F1184|nr:protein phosphatase 2C domain-containing protein [Halosimplex halophilum]